VAATHVVEIEWPLSGTDIGMTNLMPSVVIRDEGDGGVPPALDHQVIFTLFGPDAMGNEVQKSQQPSALFSPAGEPTISPATPLFTDRVGSHRLHVSLKDMSGGGAGVEDDTDEELDLNVTVSGRTARDLQMATIED
jgi:hypothetical protein